MRDELLCGITGRTAQAPMEIEVTRQRFHTESRMRASRTLRLCHATASQAGSMRGSRPKTTKSVLRVAEGRAGVPDEGCPVLLYVPMKSQWK